MGIQQAFPGRHPVILKAVTVALQSPREDHFAAA
jgi:hypothetical protein